MTIHHAWIRFAIFEGTMIVLAILLYLVLRA